MKDIAKALPWCAFWIGLFLYIGMSELPSDKIIYVDPECQKYEFTVK